MTLYEMTTQTKALYEMLQAEETEDKEQIIADTLESIEADKKIESYCQIIGQYKADIDMYSAEIKRLTAKKTTATNAVERMKKALLDFMEASGEEKIKSGVYSVSVRTSKTVIITDIYKVPAEFIRVKKEVNKTAIGELLKQGESLDYAEYGFTRGVNIK